MSCRDRGFQMDDYIMQELARAISDGSVFTTTHRHVWTETMIRCRDGRFTCRSPPGNQGCRHRSMLLEMLLKHLDELVVNFSLRAGKVYGFSRIFVQIESPDGSLSPVTNGFPLSTTGRLENVSDDTRTGVNWGHPPVCQTPSSKCVPELVVEDRRSNRFG